MAWSRSRPTRTTHRPERRWSAGASSSGPRRSRATTHDGSVLSRDLRARRSLPDRGRVPRRRGQLPGALHAATLGEWRFQVSSNLPELDGRGGSFTCVEPGPANHGPVRVSDAFHFAYADGTPVPALRDDLLRLEPPAGRAAPPDPATRSGLALQQAAHVRLPQALHLQRGRAGAPRLRPAAPMAASTSTASSPASSGSWRHASASSRTWASRPTSSSSTPTTPGATRT